MSEPRKKTQMRWETGLNDRVSKKRRGQGFEKLQNARLQERGNTLQVSRIDGYQQISGDSTSFDVVYDSTVYDNDLVVYWYDTSSGEVVVTFIDLSGSGTTQKRFTSTQADYGELTLLEDNIYLTPYDKQLNNIDGTWYLNDFISTTPTFDITASGSEFAEGSITVGNDATGTSDTVESSIGSTDISFSIEDETAEEIADQIKTEYENTSADNDYTFTVDDTTVNIEAKERGTEFNETVSASTTGGEVSFSTNDLSGGENGTLDSLTYYWYKLRYAYYDGHKTITSYPQHIKTSSTDLSAVISNIDVETDLDSNNVDVEIFRKKEGGDWFLIERVTPSGDYVDDGKVNLQPLDERNYVWVDNPLTQDIVRDRLVRANLEYQDKELGWDEGDVTFSSGGAVGDTTLPKNTEIEIFGQGRFNDGTLTPHKFLGEISIDSNNVEFWTDPQTQPSNVDDLNEVSYFGKFKTKQPTNLSFNSLEIYNENVPSLATKYESESDQDRPLNPHIFLGYKYLEVGEEIDTSSRGYVITDEDWDYDGSNYVGTSDSTDFEDDRWLLKSESGITPWGSDPPDTIDITAIDGQSLTYKLKYSTINGTSTTDINRYIYELSLVEPLKRAVSEGKTKIKLSSLNSTDVISGNKANSDFVDNEVDVIGILDTSAGRQKVYHTTDTDSNDLVHPTGKNHVYLILSSDSIYSEFNNETLNNDGVLADYDNSEIPDTTNVYNFEIIGIEEKDFGDSTTSSTYSENSNIEEYEVDYGLTEFSPLSEDNDELFYFGIQEDFDEDNATTYSNYFDGYELVKANLFEFQTLQETSVFENIISDEDLEQFQENYSNQLVWGGSYILESNASGTRDFEFTNFKNISQDYGEIVKISYINNILLVFCERGVNRINIGEVLTQQSDSQVFVDSSALLNNDQWILKNLPDVKPRSIVQYENMLFFSDGKDVWQFADGLQNVSNGKITLDIDEDFVGAIDPKNKEYQLTNGDETWVYSIELQQWQGPFTYQIETASAYRDNFYGIVGDDSVEFNSGNTFDGSSYDTVIESVANNLDDASVTKLFRKFYIETEKDATFSYGKEYGTWTDKTLSNYPDKNGVTHIGVNPSNKNGRQLYWKVTTQEQDFILRLVSFLWLARTRR